MSQRWPWPLLLVVAGIFCGHAAAELSSMVTVFCLQDCIYAPIMASHGRASWQAMGDD